MTQRRVPAAGALVYDASRRVLLVRRAHDPGAGLWSVPGGTCEPGESAASACVREVHEETGLRVRVVRAAGTVERDGPGDVVFTIEDFVCVIEDGSGPLRAASDATDACFVTAAELAGLDRAGDLVPGLVEALSGWGALPS